MSTLLKYKLSDISVGMKVYKEQLSEIYDTWIILYKNPDFDIKEDGIIGFIGKETNSISDALYSSQNIITPIFNDSIDYDDWRNFLT